MSHQTSTLCGSGSARFASYRRKTGSPARPGSRRGLGDAPAELEVQPKVPPGDGKDGHGVGDITVHSQQIELKIEQYRINGHTCQTDQLKLAQAPQALPKAALLRSEIAKRPCIVPEEVIENRHFRGDQLAARETPAH